MIATLLPSHPLLVLARSIQWPTQLDQRFFAFHLLGIVRGLRDDDLCEQWAENPYFQAFCGEDHFQLYCPVTPETLQDWRQQVGLSVLQDHVGRILPITGEKPSTFVVDVDGVVATLVPGNDYRLAQPIQASIDAINALYRRGHTIIMMTARGSATGLSWDEVTKDQFARWGLSYHQLRFGKPAADYYVDDRILSVEMLQAMAAGRSFPPSSRAPRLSLAEGGNEHQKPI